MPALDEVIHNRKQKGHTIEEDCPVYRRRVWVRCRQKNKKKNATTRKQIAMMLTCTLQTPRLNRDVRKLSRRIRFASIVLMTVRYDVNRPVADTERMILKAVVEPMIMSARRQVTASVT